jgi:hypothetical protein
MMIMFRRECRPTDHPSSVDFAAMLSPIRFPILNDRKKSGVVGD